VIFWDVIWCNVVCQYQNSCGFRQQVSPIRLCRASGMKVHDVISPKILYSFFLRTSVSPVITFLFLWKAPDTFTKTVFLIVTSLVAKMCNSKPPVPIKLSEAFRAIQFYRKDISCWNGFGRPRLQISQASCKVV